MRSGIGLFGVLLILLLLVFVVLFIVSQIAKLTWFVMTSKIVLAVIVIFCIYLFIKKQKSES